jgi:FdhD protein
MPLVPSDPSHPAIVQVPVHRARLDPADAFIWQDTSDQVAAEAPLTLRVESRAVAVIMRTPGHDRELAAGFLLTEGVIQSRSEVLEISVCPSVSGSGDSVDVILANPAAWDPDRLTRHVFTSSSCGICSKTSLTTDIPPDRILTPAAEPLITGPELAGLPGQLRQAQPAFEATGGLHGCAWWDAARRELVPGLLFEDVGRHNALDKLLGHALLTGQLPLAHGALLLSGRISFELVQKAQAARIPLIAAVGAPSSLAIAYAETAGITLCGFVREDRFNVYTHPGRIRLSGSELSGRRETQADIPRIPECPAPAGPLD